MNKNNRHWSVVVIGGGIVGAGILRDLSLHGVDTLLIDKNKISSQTSKSSSKMLHGGIRYLENLDIALVKEALQERNLWLKIAPSLCYRERFFIPVYNQSNRPLWMVLIGIALYHFLSGELKRLFSYISKTDLLRQVPTLRESGLKGAGIYEDAIVDDELLTIKVVEDALYNRACQVWENHTLEKMKRISHGRYELEISSKEGTKVVSCNDIVFSTGPFTDFLLKKLNAFPWEPKLILSKGSHLWIEKSVLSLPNPVVLTPNDGRVIFVIPYPDKILVGTTEVLLTEPTSNIQPSDEEIDYLIDNLIEFFPHANVTREHMIDAFSGIRPLVKDSSSSLGKTSRDHHIFQPTNNCYVILGGKYTTFRVMAADMTATLVRKKGIPYKNYLTMQPFRSDRKDRA